MQKPWCVTVWVGVVLVLVGAGSSASADMLITLTPRDQSGEAVTAPVAPGERLAVDILLSVDGADDPLTDVFLVQFDFTSTSATIGVESFAWSTDFDVYEFRTATLPVPAALTLCLTCPASVCQNCVILLALTSEPRLVATVNVIVTDEGTLNVVGGTGIGQVTQTRIDSGFESLKMFWLAAGNLIGGTLDLSVQSDPPADGGGGSSDGDGMDDTVDPDGDAADGDGSDPPDPDDPASGGDMDPPGDAPSDDGGDDGVPDDPSGDDGAGDMEPPMDDEPSDGAGSPAFCGAAMMGTLLMTLLGLLSLSIANRPSKQG